MMLLTVHTVSQTHHSLWLSMFLLETTERYFSVTHLFLNFEVLSQQSHEQHSSLGFSHFTASLSKPIGILCSCCLGPYLYPILQEVLLSHHAHRVYMDLPQTHLQTLWCNTSYCQVRHRAPVMAPSN